MVGAYIQIIIMLLGAFLLGMFVAWQYWRKKFKKLEDDYHQLEQETSKTIQGLEQKVTTLKREVEERDKKVEELNKSVKDFKSEVKAIKGELEERDKQVEESEKSIKKLERRVKKVEGELQKKDQMIEELESREKILNQEVELLDQELVEAHDELYAINRKPKKSTYYKYIDGKRYKAATLKEAEGAVGGKGDGRISMEDARKIFGTISDGKQYTPVEKATIRYLRENYNWTEQADELFRHLVGSWAAHDHNPDEIQE